ncbi:MAG: efflux RND transporter periplasmic adaptor subunit [Planctomycetes bacterium]|nr:efflux RND transporter periplasmic adaptor subunit [Planctomycetota bacterium]
MRPTQRWFLLGLAGGALAGWFGARFISKPADAPHASAAPTPSLPAPAHVGNAERVSVPELELLPASLRSRRTSVLSSELQARVLQVAHRAGERVAEGESLIELDPSAPQAALEVAEQARVAAEAGLKSAGDAVELAQVLLEEARAHRARTDKLFESKSATAESLEQAHARHAAAQAGLAQAQSGVSAAQAQLAQAAAAVQQAGLALAHASIRAPFAGVLAERNVEPGEIVAPARALLVLVDPAQLRAVAIAREELAGALVPGQTLEVEVPAAGVTLAGRIEELAPRVDERSRSLELRLWLDATPSCLPGMYARVRLARGAHDVVLVPERALVRVGQLAALCVREDGVWTRRHVSVGATHTDGRIEVLAGLSGGETIGWDGEGL